VLIKWFEYKQLIIIIIIIIIQFLIIIRGNLINQVFDLFFSGHEYRYF
jgi:hypothetical protein